LHISSRSVIIIQNATVCTKTAATILQKYTFTVLLLLTVDNIKKYQVSWKWVN